MATTTTPANDVQLLEVSEGLRALRLRTDIKMVLRMESHFVGDTEALWRSAHEDALGPQAEVYNARVVAKEADERVRRSMRRVTRLVTDAEESISRELIKQALGGVTMAALFTLGRRARVLRLRGLVAAIQPRTELAGATSELPELTAATEALDLAETALDAANNAARAAVDARKAARAAFLRGYKGFVNALSGDPTAPAIDTILPVFTKAAAKVEG
jgi:hypothetical protein